MNPRAACLGLAALAAGCAVPLDANKHTIIVVGFGIVQTSSANQVSVNNHKVAGMMVNDPQNKFALGYSSGFTVSIPTNANVLIEINSAGKTKTIQSQSIK
jgi:hypothetical protein